MCPGSNVPPLGSCSEQCPQCKHFETTVISTAPITDSACTPGLGCCPVPVNEQPTGTIKISKKIMDYFAITKFQRSVPDRTLHLLESVDLAHPVLSATNNLLCVAQWLNNHQLILSTMLSFFAQTELHPLLPALRVAVLTMPASRELVVRFVVQLDR